MTLFRAVHVGGCIFERLIIHIEKIGNIDTRADRMNYSSFPKLFDLIGFYCDELRSEISCSAFARTKQTRNITQCLYIFTKLLVACEYKHCTCFRCKAKIVCVVRNARSLSFFFSLIPRRYLLFSASNYLARIF